METCFALPAPVGLNVSLQREAHPPGSDRGRLFTSKRPRNPPNRCCKCGEICGDAYAAYENDRSAARGLVTCEACFQRGTVPQ
jgi:hypothetical protein